VTQLLTTKKMLHRFVARRLRNFNSYRQNESFWSWIFSQQDIERTKLGNNSSEVDAVSWLPTLMRILSGLPLLFLYKESHRCLSLSFDQITHSPTTKAQTAISTTMAPWRNEPPYKQEFDQAGEDTSSAKASYRASCFCRRVQYEVRGEPESAKLCHCRGCQLLHGAPFEWVGFRKTPFCLVFQTRNQSSYTFP
jgi:hypothetical protein